MNLHCLISYSLQYFGQCVGEAATGALVPYILPGAVYMFISPTYWLSSLQYQVKILGHVLLPLVNDSKPNFPLFIARLIVTLL